MIKYKLCFVLLLPLTVCSDSEETLVKTIGSEPDLTPVCDNSTQAIITLIVCKIRTERNREECRLLYEHEHGFKHECDPRFTLMTDNQTVFLHLMSLTPVDSGSITCHCSDPDGTFILHLNVTMEVVESAGHAMQLLLPVIVICATTIFITICGLIVGIILRTRSNRSSSRSATGGSSICETPGSLNQDDPDDPDDPYTSLQQPDSDLYQTISTLACKPAVADQQIQEEETELSSTNYENLRSK